MDEFGKWNCDEMGKDSIYRKWHVRIVMSFEFAVVGDVECASKTSHRLGL